MILARLLSAQPMKDGEKWKMKFQAHRDEWYVDAYGQDPAPFHREATSLQPATRLPYPWKPGATAYSSVDALFPEGGLGITLDRAVYPAKVAASGFAPVNLPGSSVFAPSVPNDATILSSGGTIRAVATWYVAIAWDGIKGPVSPLVRAVVSSGISNQIQVSGIAWPDAAAPSVQVFIGPSIFDMGSIAFTGSAPDANGNPTTITIAARPTIPTSGDGLPDSVFQRFVMQQTVIAHGGVWGAVLTGASGSTVTIAGAGWTTNQWRDYKLALYFRDGDGQIGANLAVVSNTADTLTLSHSGVFAAGDVVVMRAIADYITDNTIGDDYFENSFAPTGLDTGGVEIGRLIRIIAGTGANQPDKTIISNTSKVFTINGSWDVMPDATSVWIVLESSHKQKQSGVITTDGSGGGAVTDVISDDAPSTAAQSILVEVATADIHGNYLPMRYQPFREVYVPGQNAARDGYLTVVAVSGNVTLDLALGRNFRFVLTGASSTILAPLNAGGVEAGDWFTLYLDQDATGSRNLPTFTGGTAGFVSNTSAQIQIDPTASTRTSLTFTFHGSYWALDSQQTGVALS